MTSCFIQNNTIEFSVDDDYVGCGEAETKRWVEVEILECFVHQKYIVGVRCYRCIMKENT